jgi:hypothetical protein
MMEDFGNEEFLSMGILRGEPGGGSFAGNTKGYVKEGSENGKLSP